MPTRIFVSIALDRRSPLARRDARIGVAYDLFGNGRTALKANLGKYLMALTASNSDMDLNPLIRTNLFTTRHGNEPKRIGDQQRLRAAVRPEQPGQERRMRRDGQSDLRQGVLHAYVRSCLHQWRGKRPYNWELGVSVQQEVARASGSRSAISAAGSANFYTLDNHPDKVVGLHGVQRADPRGFAAAGRRRRDGERSV